MKRFITMCITLVLLVLCIVPIYASSDVCVIDSTNLFSDQNLEILNNLAKDLQEEYKFGVYIRVVDDAYEDIDIEEYADDIYFNEDLGTNATKDGVLLLLDPVNRRYDLMAHGIGNTIFTDYGKDEIANNFVPYMKFDNFKQACVTYLNDVGTYLNDFYNNSVVIDSNESNNVDSNYVVHKDSQTDIKNGLVMCFVASCGLTALILFLMYRSMHSTGKQYTAAGYSKNGLQLTRHHDIFVGSTTTRTYSPRDTNNNGGGGGTSIGSSGSSHHSGSF